MSSAVLPRSRAPARAAVPRSRDRRGERALFHRYHSLGDHSAREDLAKRFMPLARQLARRHQNGREPLEDLVQVASLGLVKAIDRFDSSRGTAFSSYAVPTISGELKRYFRDSAWSAHVPRGMQERVLAVNGTIARLSRDLGRSPSVQEVAATMDSDSETVLEAMEASMAYDSVSLDGPQRPDGEEMGVSHAETIGEEDPAYELVDYRDATAAAMATLPKREQTVLRLRFVEGLTQSEIGRRIGVSQMHVSRLKRRALKQLHEQV